nr:hypothetical protein [uncultured Duganella sp.]
MERRKDFDTSVSVENGLVVDDALGSAAAWEYLVEHGVGGPLILRVLASGNRRRRSDPAAVAPPLS